MHTSVSLVGLLLTDHILTLNCRSGLAIITNRLHVAGFEVYILQFDNLLLVR